MRLDSVNTSLTVPVYSPMTKSVEVVKYGSNRLRKKLHHIPAADLPKGRLKEPLIKGLRYKHRLAGVLSAKAKHDPNAQKKAPKGRIRRYIDAQSGVKP